MERGIWYSDVMDLGFIRSNASDGVYKSQYGHDYYFVYKEVLDVSFDWNMFSKSVNMSLLDESKNIVKTKVITELSELEQILDDFDSMLKIQQFTENKINDYFK